MFDLFQSRNGWYLKIGWIYINILRTIQEILFGIVFEYEII